MAERKVCANPGCEKKFTAKHNNKKYCTVQCSRKAQHKRAYEIECKNEDRYQGAIIGVKDAQAQLLSTKNQEAEIKPSDAKKSN